MKKYKTNFYIDGFNFYHGICDIGDKERLWIDVVKLARNIKRRNERIRSINYFTALPENITHSNDPTFLFRLHAKQNRHKLFIELIENLDHPVNVQLGKFKKKTIHCSFCGNIFIKPEEKRTDVNIAIKMVEDAFRDDCDSFYIISGDTDLIPPIKQIKNNFPNKRISVWFPPKRKSYELVKNCDFAGSITGALLDNCKAPNPFITPEGKKLIMPLEWSNS